MVKVDSQQTTDRWRITLYVVWPRSGDWGETDQLTLVATTYEVDKHSGQVDIETRQQETFAGHTNSPGR